MVKMLAVGIIAVLMTGCGNSAPKCDDSDVKELVLDIALDNANYRKLYDSASDIYIVNGESLSGDQFRAKYTNGGVLQIIGTIERYKNAKIKNIRTESTDDELEKSTCKAQLETGATTIGKANWPARLIDITYTLSKTSDGNLFAEVSGLPNLK